MERQDRHGDLQCRHVRDPDCKGNHRFLLRLERGLYGDRFDLHGGNVGHTERDR